jgi:hypothetical protein
MLDFKKSNIAVFQIRTSGHKNVDCEFYEKFSKLNSKNTQKLHRLQMKMIVTTYKSKSVFG